MRASKFSINGMTELALKHLRRNASLLTEKSANRLLSSAVVQSARPYIIALDAIDLDRVTDFQWSPFYSGTDIHRALAANSIVEGMTCDDMLAMNIRRRITVDCSPDVVFPDSMASRNDPFLANVTRQLAFCDDRVYYIVLQNDSDAAWLALFDDTLRFASNAGSFDIGFCTRVPHADKMEWTSQQLNAMIDSASCVFAAALDGEGYLVWEL